MSTTASTKPAGIAIRPARPGEESELTALALRSKASNGYDEVFMAACVAELTVPAEAVAAGEVHVAGEDVAQGMYRLIVKGDLGHVEDMFVDPGAKRGGIGRALWMHMEARAREHGCKRLELDADPFAVPFYKAMGMKITGESPSGSIPGRMLPRMEKAL